MKFIQSAKNPQIKQWKKLLTRKERDKTGLFLAEGYHLVEEGLKADRIQHIIIAEDQELPRNLDYGPTPITVVTKEIMKELSDTETPQGIIAVCWQERTGQGEINGSAFLLLDAVQDPGNLGTLIRTADAAGIDAVIAGPGTVDIYNPKVIRSAQGSHFHIPVIRDELNKWIEKLQKDKIPVYGTALENGADFREIAPSRSFALLVGNEGRGVSKELLELTDKNLYIPIYGKSESLNVAVAAGILMYHLRLPE